MTSRQRSRSASATLTNASGGTPNLAGGAVFHAVNGLRRLGSAAVRRYNRLEVIVDAPLPREPALLVANHGFGGILDLNVFAIFAALDDLALDRPVTSLTHHLAWRAGLGKLVEAAGARPASRESALAAFDAGHHVLVLPGGDLDAGKPWHKRNRIVFGGRRGYARLALETGVPIVPIVTAGAGESLLVLSDGQRLAKALGADRHLRSKALPVSVSIPWGLNVGLVGLAPYVPLPTKLVTRVLPGMRPDAAETADSYADRIERAMQTALTAMTKNRRIIRG
jgi:1-acyl-sn-glycerol-3-phosphate acyltransferase